MWNFKTIIKSLKTAFDDDIGTYGAWSDVWNQKSTIDNLSCDQLLTLYKGWVFASCDVIGDGMKMLDTVLFKSEARQDLMKTHEYKKLIDGEMIKGMSVYLKTCGATYLYKETAGTNIINLKLLKTGNVQENKDANNNLLNYWYTDGASQWTFEVDDIIAIKTFNPILSDTGMTPLKAVANQVAMDFASVEYNKAFFENGGKPGTVLSHDKKITPEDRDAYLAKWKKNFTGINNAHKVAFVDQGIKIQDFGTTQKDMDLSSQRAFTMEEVLMSFRVSKPILGKADGVGFADRKVPGYYFNEYTLKPLAKLIQDELNVQLFAGIGHFVFLFPQDKEELRQEWTAGLITHNQYLISTGRPLIENGNVLWNGEAVEFEGVKVDPSKRKKDSEIEESIAKGLIKTFDLKKFGTDEYNGVVWKAKIGRTDKYEDEVMKRQIKIFNEQEKAILKELDSKTKAINKESDIITPKASNLLYTTLYTPFFTNMMNVEGNIALNEIKKQKFDVSSLNKWIGEDIDRMSKDIDETTRKEMFAIIKQGNKDGIGADAIALNIKQEFKSYKRKNGRVEQIARTEVTKASNKSQEEAYEQSGVVDEKEWFTALDERVSPQCLALQGKRIKIGGSYYKKGDTAVNGPKVTYETVYFPPLHVNCRCTLRPVISTKSFKEVFDNLSQKGITLINK